MVSPWLTTFPLFIFVANIDKSDSLSFFFEIKSNIIFNDQIVKPFASSVKKGEISEPLKARTTFDNNLIDKIRISFS